MKNICLSATSRLLKTSRAKTPRMALKPGPSATLLLPIYFPSLEGEVNGRRDTSEPAGAQGETINHLNNSKI